MSALYPATLMVRNRCPACGRWLGRLKPRLVDSAVQVECPHEGCDYRADVIWLGNLAPPLRFVKKS
jgi:hypothetical protein